MIDKVYKWRLVCAIHGVVHNYNEDDTTPPTCPVNAADTINSSSIADTCDSTVRRNLNELPQGGKKVTYRGFQFTAAANSETTHNFVFTENVYLKDGDLEVKDSDFKDYAYMALVDTDYLHAGVLYPSEPAPGVTWAQAMPDGVVLHEYIKDYPIDSRSNPSVTVIPNEAITDLNLNGLTMRVKYMNNNISTDVACKVRMRAYS